MVPGALDCACVGVGELPSANSSAVKNRNTFVVFIFELLKWCQAPLFISSFFSLLLFHAILTT